MDAALLARRTTTDELRAAAVSVAGWRGASRAVPAAQLAAESALETRGRLRILGAGLAAPELQVEIRTPRPAGGCGRRVVRRVPRWQWSSTAG